MVAAAIAASQIDHLIDVIENPTLSENWRASRMGSTYAQWSGRPDGPIYKGGLPPSAHRRRPYTEAQWWDFPEYTSGEKEQGLWSACPRRRRARYSQR